MALFPAANRSRAISAVMSAGVGSSNAQAWQASSASSTRPRTASMTAERYQQLPRLEQQRELPEMGTRPQLSVALDESVLRRWGSGVRAVPATVAAPPWRSRRSGGGQERLELPVTHGLKWAVCRVSGLGKGRTASRAFRSAAARLEQWCRRRPELGESLLRWTLRP
jgi:hypothetical protein